MAIQKNVDLSALNTLGISALAAEFCEVTTLLELQEALAVAEAEGKPIYVLGGGSNTVFRGDFSGLLIRMAMQGIRCEAEGDTRLVYAAAGENWDALVRYCLEQGWYGIENLIAIPGSVGAAPIQNIGAYGVELAACLVSVRGVDIATGEEQVMALEDCQLAYRDSIFKHALKDRFIITEICLRLSTDSVPNLSYAALAESMPEGEAASPELVARVVEQTRQAKLPDPAREPNVGSFFKNPIIDLAQAESLLQQYPAMAHWPVSDEAGAKVKVAAAWLVDQCGWKGRRLGKVGVHPRQAIVLVNYDRGGAEEVLALASAIQEDVHARFGVSLEIEPRVC